MTNVRSADGRELGRAWTAAATHDARPPSLGLQRRRFNAGAALSRVAPQRWRLALAACGLTFAGHVFYGANTDASGLIFATAWLVLGAIALVGSWPTTAVRPGVLLLLASVLFLGAVVAVGSQLLPAAGSAAHPLWAETGQGGALTVDRDATRRELFKLISMAATVTVGFLIGVSERRVRFFVSCVLASSVVYAGWAFLEHFAGLGRLFGAEKPLHADRLTASFLSANSAATMLGMLAVVAAGRLFQAVKESAAAGREGVSTLDGLSRRGGLPAMALLLLTTCVMATGSRAGVGVTFVSLLAFVGWELRAASDRETRLHRGVAPVAVAALTLVLVGILGAETTAGRLGATVTDAGARVTALEAHWQAFLASPWRGHGLGAFPVVNDLIQDPANHSALRQLNATHNVYIQWLEETGVVGAALMLGCIGCLLTRIVVGISGRRRMRTWMRAVLAMSLLVAAHGLVDYALQVPSIAWQWALWLGLGCGVASAVEPRSHDEDDDREDHSSGEMAARSA